jgi:hypothetical protein
MSTKQKKTLIKKPEEPIQPPALEEDLEEEEDKQQYAASTTFTPNAAVEPSNSLKNFRHHPDMENFYRFIFENDLRHEALKFLEQTLTDKRKKTEKN